VKEDDPRSTFAPPPENKFTSSPAAQQNTNLYESCCPMEAIGAALGSLDTIGAAEDSALRIFLVAGDRASRGDSYREASGRELEIQVPTAEQARSQ
jgi:hypothetical protein